MFTLVDSHTGVSILSDAETTAHVTPLKEVLRNTHTVNRSCTFGNKGQLVLPKGREAPLNVTLVEIRQIAGLPYRLLSTETIRCDGGEFMDSGTKESHVRFNTDGPKIPLVEMQK